jgi:DNA helicase IV
MFEFKLLNDEDSLNEESIKDISKELEKINEEINSINNLLITFNKTTKEQNPLIIDLERDIIKLREDIQQARSDLEKSEEYKNINRKNTAFISAGIGSLSGGTIGILFTPILGPTVPIITTIVGGISGAIYSLF